MYSLGFMPNSRQKARVNVSTFAKPASKAISITLSPPSRSLFAACVSLYLRMYSAGVMPMYSLKSRYEYHGENSDALERSDKLISLALFCSM